MIPAGWRRALLAGWVAAVIVWAGLPAAGAGAGGLLLARLAALGALTLAALAYDGRPPLRRVSLALAALVGLAVLGVAQALPWPPALARLVSPEHAELTAAAWTLLEPGREPAAARGVALSLAPELSRSAALTVVATAVFLGAAFVAGAGRRRRRWLAVALVGSGVLQIVLGLREWLAGSAPRLRGSFANPNHLAYSLEIALAVAFAWAAWGVYAQRYQTRVERKLVLVAPPIAAWLVCAAGLLWTGSRAGLAAAAACLLLQVLLLTPVIHGATRGLAPKAVAATVMALLAFFAIRGSVRLSETTLYEVAWGERSAVWSESLRLWTRFPVSGTGLGTFGEAFPLVQPAATVELYWRRAHNDPIELLVTGGVIGVALGLLALAGLVAPLARVLRWGFRTEDRAAALAGLGALAAVSVHELMDFGLTLPGVALPLAAVVGAGGAARVKRRSRAATPGPGVAAGE